MKKDRNPTNTRALDKARVLELLAENPQSNKRDLAKLLGLKGSDRIVLKRILKELEAEGAIEGRKNNIRIWTLAPAALTRNRHAVAKKIRDCFATAMIADETCDAPR